MRAAADELAAKGHKILAIRCDVADDAQVETMVAQTVAMFGRLDVAYNNAGVQNVLAETADARRDDYDRVGFQLRHGSVDLGRRRLRHAVGMRACPGRDATVLIRRLLRNQQLRPASRSRLVLDDDLDITSKEDEKPDESIEGKSGESAAREGGHLRLIDL